MYGLPYLPQISVSTREEATALELGLSLLGSLFFPKTQDPPAGPEVRIGGQFQPFSFKNTYHLPLGSSGEFLMCHWSFSKARPDLLIGAADKGQPGVLSRLDRSHFGAAQAES